MEHTLITRREKEKDTQWEKITKSEMTYLETQLPVSTGLNYREAFIAGVLGEETLIISEGFRDEAVGVLEEKLLHPLLKSEAQSDRDYRHEKVFDGDLSFLVLLFPHNPIITPQSRKREQEARKIYNGMAPSTRTPR